MDIYRAQRQHRTLDGDISGGNAPSDNFYHGTKGVLVYNINSGTGSGTGLDVHLMGATSGRTFAATMICLSGEATVLPFKIFGANTNGLGYSNRGIVGLY